MRILVIIIMLAVCANANAQILDKLKAVVTSFSDIDTAYIEPQHYNWSVMWQASHYVDIFRLSGSGSNHQSVKLKPTPSLRMGPYFGWRWLFLGYTVDLKTLGVGGSNKKKKEFMLSIYSSKIGIDLYYRKTGVDYKITNVNMGRGIDASKLIGETFDGIRVGVSGASAYYIFNNRRFSYPAAFSQSTCQKISCGSFMAGAGFTRNSLSMDNEKYVQLIKEKVPSVQVDSSMLFNSVKYSNLSFSGGYGYNWVFAKNWLLCGSGALIISYKHSSGEMNKKNVRDPLFDFNNINLDQNLRIGLIWNNTRWYAGANAVLNVNNYHNNDFSASNIYGTANVYVGYNFGLRKEYRKKK